jgi:hypothetical protein
MHVMRQQDSKRQPYDRATVVVIDAVGEFETITIWAAEYDSKGMQSISDFGHNIIHIQLDYSTLRLLAVLAYAH